MRKSWIVVTDGIKARIFEKKTSGQPLCKFEDLYHPLAGKSHNMPEEHIHGSFNGNAGKHTDVTPSAKQSACQNDLFAQSIALYLDKGRKNSRYHQLYLISPPYFLGILRNCLEKKVNRLIENEWTHELPDMSASEVEKFLEQKAVWQ